MDGRPRVAEDLLISCVADARRKDLRRMDDWTDDLAIADDIDTVHYLPTTCVAEGPTKGRISTV